MVIMNHDIFGRETAPTGPYNADCIFCYRATRVVRSRQVVPEFQAAVQQDSPATETAPVGKMITRNHRRPSVDNAVCITDFQSINQPFCFVFKTSVFSFQCTNAYTIVVGHMHVSYYFSCLGHDEFVLRSCQK